MAIIRLCMLFILISGCGTLKMVADEVDGSEVSSSRQQRAERERIKQVIEAVDEQIEDSGRGGTESLPEEESDEKEPK